MKKSIQVESTQLNYAWTSFKKRLIWMNKLVLLLAVLTSCTTANIELSKEKWQWMANKNVDSLVSTKHSRLLSSWLTVAGVLNKLVIVKNAPHFGGMFDSDEVREKVLNFQSKQLN